MPAATAAPEPDEEPPVEIPRVARVACRAKRRALPQPEGEVLQLVFPVITAPASRRRSTTTASSVGTTTGVRRPPLVIGTPATAMQSFTPTVLPARGPSGDSSYLAETDEGVVRILLWRRGPTRIAVKMPQRRWGLVQFLDAGYSPPATRSRRLRGQTAPRESDAGGGGRRTRRPGRSSGGACSPRLGIDPSGPPLFRNDIVAFRTTWWHGRPTPAPAACAPSVMITTVT